MKRMTVTALGLLVFLLVFVSFLVRAIGQFLIGPRRATLYAGPIALLAGVVLLVVIGVVLGVKAGIVTLEDGGD